MKLRTTSIADADIAAAALWLDQRNPGHGYTFMDAVDRTFKTITNAPLACPTYISPDFTFKLPLRSRVVGAFEHRIIFALQSDEIQVVAVLHPSRNLDSILSERVGTL